VVGPCEAPPTAGCTAARGAGCTVAFGAGFGAAAFGAGLGGGLGFFSAPQASAADIIRTKITINFMRILLFGMFKLLTISYSAKSILLYAFTIENGGKSETPWNLVDHIGFLSLRVR
jgi:hypothetical protein